MPWKKVNPMDQRLMFTADYLRGVCPSFSALCRRYNISRKTGYKWVQRYKAGGLDALQEQSRRPRSHPDAIPYAIRQEILGLRHRYSITLGPKKIQVKLVEKFPDLKPPSLTSIHTILKRGGLIQPRKRRGKVRPFDHPLGEAREPNDLWTVDFKGEFRLGNGHWCYPLTVMDSSSRYLLRVEGLESPNTALTQATFSRLFERYGLPRRIRSDNGVPFATRATAGLSRLSVWWIRLGVLPERIRAGCPQENGQHERMHKTLKQAVTRPVSSNMSGQQQRFDVFCEEYNEHVPHEALGQTVPASHYVPSDRHWSGKLMELEYASHMEIKVVSRTGVVYWKGGQVYVSGLLKGERVAMEEVADGIWQIWFGPIRLGDFDQRVTTGRAIPYWSIKKCNPCI